MAAMLVLVCPRDENVVNVHEDEGQVAEDVIHEALKRLGGVAKTERHSSKLEEVERGSDGSLRVVIGMNRDEMIGTYQVDFGKHSIHRGGRM